MKPIHIFKTGTHTDSNGTRITFSESDLAAAVGAYDSAKHQAPIVVGHPKTDNPAFGWITNLTAKNGNLYATPEQLNAEFSEQVQKGAYKKVSASFYPPNSPNNPVKGKYYLRHVGFLGAEPPAIKGLSPIEFAEESDAVNIELELNFNESSEGADSHDGKIVKAAKNFLALVFGESSAETASASTSSDVGSHTSTQPTNQPNQSDNSNDDHIDNTNDESSNQNQTPKTDKEQDMATQAELDEKQVQIDKLQKQIEDKEKAEAEEKAKAVEQANADFAEGLVNDGKIAPKDKDLVTATLNGLERDHANAPVEFGEGDKKKPLAQALKDKLADANTSTFAHLFSEAAGKPTGTKAHTFEAPSGTAVDADRLDLHNQALEYSEAHKVSYDIALDMIG